MNRTVNLIVSELGLSTHPEGGYYKENYRSGETISRHFLPQRFSGDRQFSTAIYFLLEQGNFSAFHRIQSDECWHFYEGQTLHIHVIDPLGQYSLIRLGNKTESGEVYQAIVPAGSWFASETAAGGTYSLTGCTVAPGFDFADFELANAEELAMQFPEHAVLIHRLCR